jgi:hypothetical protein
MIIVIQRAIANAIVEDAGQSGEPKAATEGRQDKKPHIAAWTVGCFDLSFCLFSHLAPVRCEVCTAILACHFNENRTSRWMGP